MPDKHADADHTFPVTNTEVLTEAGRQLVEDGSALRTTDPDEQGERARDSVAGDVSELSADLIAAGAEVQEMKDDIANDVEGGLMRLLGSSAQLFAEAAEAADRASTALADGDTETAMHETANAFFAIADGLSDDDHALGRMLVDVGQAAGEGLGESAGAAAVAGGTFIEGAVDAAVGAANGLRDAVADLLGFGDDNSAEATADRTLTDYGPKADPVDVEPLPGPLGPEMSSGDADEDGTPDSLQADAPPAPPAPLMDVPSDGGQGHGADQPGGASDAPPLLGPLGADASDGDADGNEIPDSLQAEPAPPSPIVDEPGNAGHPPSADEPGGANDADHTFPVTNTEVLTEAGRQLVEDGSALRTTDPDEQGERARDSVAGDVSELSADLIAAGAEVQEMKDDIANDVEGGLMRLLGSSAQLFAEAAEAADRASTALADGDTETAMHETANAFFAIADGLSDDDHALGRMLVDVGQAAGEGLGESAGAAAVAGGTFIEGAVDAAVGAANGLRDAVADLLGFGDDNSAEATADRTLTDYGPKADPVDVEPLPGPLGPEMSSGDADEDGTPDSLQADAPPAPPAPLMDVPSDGGQGHGADQPGGASDAPPLLGPLGADASDGDADGNEIPDSLQAEPAPPSPIVDEPGNAGHPPSADEPGGANDAGHPPSADEPGGANDAGHPPSADEPGGANDAGHPPSADEPGGANDAGHPPSADEPGGANDAGHPPSADELSDTDGGD